MNNDEIMVSINCLAYNHEKYIRKCLDGFIMQKTNFKFEVLVHDDASTDKTAEIIREYELKYPDIIKPVYQTENQYCKHINISKSYQFPRAKGKYWASCEGDDYWSDPLKLQKQFDIMEENPDCVFSMHRVRCINENGEKTENTIPAIKMETVIMTPKEFLESLCCRKGTYYQTSSFFYRKDLSPIAFLSELPFRRVTSFSDFPIQLYFATKGNFVYIDEEMSCYRLNSIGSWSQRNADKKSNVSQQYIRMLEEFDKYTDYEYSDILRKGIQREKYKEALQDKNYKELVKKEYRCYLKDYLSTKDRIYIYYRYFCDILNIRKD